MLLEQPGDQQSASQAFVNRALEGVGRMTLRSAVGLVNFTQQAINGTHDYTRVAGESSNNRPEDSMWQPEISGDVAFVTGAFITIAVSGLAHHLGCDLVS